MSLLFVIEGLQIILLCRHDFARRLEDARHQITDKIEASTQLLLRNIQKVSNIGLSLLAKLLSLTDTGLATQLDEGPYEWIEDENIKKVWKGKLSFCVISMVS